MKSELTGFSQGFNMEQRQEEKKCSQGFKSYASFYFSEALLVDHTVLIRLYTLTSEVLFQLTTIPEKYAIRYQELTHTEVQYKCTTPGEKLAVICYSNTVTFREE